MPELSSFFNIIIRMQFSDIGEHNKPHVHIQYSEHKAVVALDGELLASNIPLKQFKLIEAWLTIHEEELYTAWNNAVRNIPFDKIEPLR